MDRTDGGADVSEKIAVVAAKILGILGLVMLGIHYGGSITPTGAEVIFRLVQA